MRFLSPSTGVAAASLQDVAAAASRCAPAAALRLLATSAGGVEPDELPLPESKLKDDVEDALHGEAEELPVEEDAAAVLAGGGAAQPAAPAGGIAALPLGQGLRQEASFQGRNWTFETGRMARLANGSCMVQAGGTTVLAAATCQPPPWSRRDALSLQFEVRDRVAARAVLPGGALACRRRWWCVPRSSRQLPCTSSSAALLQLQGCSLPS